MSRIINAYHALGINPYNDRGGWRNVEAPVIRSALVTIIAAVHPDLARQPEDNWLDRIEDAHLGAMVLLGSEREAHDAARRSGADYRTDTVPESFAGVDIVAWLIGYAVNTGARVCQYLPAFIPEERLEGLERLGLAEAWMGAVERIGEISDDNNCPGSTRESADELARWLGRRERVEVVFRAKDWASTGGAVRAETKKVTAAAQIHRVGNPHHAPVVRITINLPLWLESGPAERERLIFRHLWACRPRYDADKREWRVSIAKPDVEEYGEVVRLYGVRDAKQAAMVVYGAAHPETAKRVELWHSTMYEGAQAVLFEAIRR